MTGDGSGRILHPDHYPPQFPREPWRTRETLPDVTLKIHPVQVRSGVWQIVIPYGSGTYDIIAAVALLPVALYLHDAAYRAFVRP